MKGERGHSAQGKLQEGRKDKDHLFLDSAEIHLYLVTGIGILHSGGRGVSR